VRYRFTSPLWRWRARSDAWFFVTVPEDEGDEIRAIVGDLAGGFGSVRVRVTVGSTTWLTSIFPESGSTAYSLPMKAAVRRAEAISEGDQVTVDLELQLSPAGRAAGALAAPGTAAPRTRPRSARREAGRSRPIASRFCAPRSR
jgi:hypothetical protein